MRKLLMLLAVLSLAVSAASAQTVEWHGVNTSFATSLDDNDIYNANFWFDPATEAYRLPTAADEAYFNFNSTAFARDDLSLIENPDPQGDDFIARKLSMIGYTSTAPLYVRMDLSLESIYLRMGGNWSGGDQNLRIGAADTQAQLAMRKADIIAAAGGDVTITGSASATLSLAGLSEDFATKRSEIMGRINELTATTGVAAKQPPN